ncbi:MAG: Crp/Fnr family transcriptional regulator [Candidatus Eisenbacteria bacterium]|nr:Crp/Fnr family transcriptional regulator [Candidatus Eisenbacteria bacterium]
MDRPDRCLLCESRLSNSVCQAVTTSLAKMSEIARPNRYLDGENLFTQGEPTGEVFIISSGRVKLTHTHPDGIEQLVRVAGPGETLGVGMSRGATLLMSAVARGQVSACRVRLTILERAAQREPELALAWAHVLMEEMRRAREQVLHHSAHPASTRIARYLLDALREGWMANPSCAPLVQLTHAEIASELAIAQETATRLLRDLEEQNVVRLGRGRIEVLDLDLLAALAGHPGTIVST